MNLEMFIDPAARGEFHRIHFCNNPAAAGTVRYVKRGEALPPVIRFRDADYRQGQCSGPCQSQVFYERIA